MFDFEPRLVVVKSKNLDTVGGSVWIYGVTSALGVPQTSGNYQVTLSWNGNTVSWYSTVNATYQLNTESNTMIWLAIG